MVYYMIHYNKNNKMVRLLELSSHDCEDVSAAVVIHNIKRGVHIRNLDIDKNELISTSGSFNRYTGNSITLLERVTGGRNNNKLIGYELSTSTGEVAKLSIEDTLKAGRMYGLTNAKIMSGANGDYICRIYTSNDRRPSITEIRKSVPEAKSIELKAQMLGSSGNEMIYKKLLAKSNKIKQILKYDGADDSIKYTSVGAANGNKKYSIFVTNMSNLYSTYTNSKAIIDLGGLDTSNVTNMHSMFRYTRANKIDLHNINTSRVINMAGMFYKCSANVIDLSGIDTSNVINMSNMFSRSTGKLILNSFDLSNVINMSGMFEYCGADVLDLSSFNIKDDNSINCDGMFNYCKAKKIICSKKIAEIVHNSAECFASIELID